jgi:hypothetical protein
MAKNIKDTFDAKLESCKISTIHTANLAINDRDRNHNGFVGHMTMPQFIAPSPEGALQGLTITKKNCYFKRPDYDKGEWESQFAHRDDYENQVQFNVQTKRKTSFKP